MSEWIDCPKCGTNHENLCACPEPFIKQPDEERTLLQQQEECDHEWKEIDASFDHEFGTEQVFYRECQKCGKQGRSHPFSYGDEYA